MRLFRWLWPAAPPRAPAHILVFTEFGEHLRRLFAERPPRREPRVIRLITGGRR